MNNIESTDQQYVRFVRSVNSDTATMEEMRAKIAAFRSTLIEDWKKQLFDDVVYDCFMVDTPIQVERRKSGECDQWKLSE